MKKIYIVLFSIILASLCACDSSTQTANETSASDANISTVAEITTKKPKSTAKTKHSEAAVYSDIVKGLGGAENTFYALYDLDGDGAKELLLGLEIWEGDMCPYLVFAIQNGTAVRQESYLWFEGNGPAPIVFETGAIRVEFLDDGGSRFYYYQMQSGELKFRLTLIKENIDYDNEIQGYRHGYFRLDPDIEERIPITPKEFGLAQKELEGDGQTAKLHKALWHRHLPPRLIYSRAIIKTQKSTSQLATLEI